MDGGDDVGGLEAKEVLLHAGCDGRCFLEDLREAGVHDCHVVADGGLGDGRVFTEDVVEEGAPAGARAAVAEMGYYVFEHAVEVRDEVPAAEPGGRSDLDFGAARGGTDDEGGGGGVGCAGEADVGEEVIVGFGRIGDVALLFAAADDTSPDYRGIDV